MTEYTEEVEKQRILQQAEKWGKGVKYIHANNGIIETKFNNGDIQYDRDGRISWHREKPTKKTLIATFHRALADMIKKEK
tara:strand:+ start:240 stop:479 length:240 start_codon:yes stop_codon:yes gene_type:complete